MIEECSLWKQKKVKALSHISQCFFFFLILHLAEELLIIPKLYNTKGIISCVGGFVILLFYIRFINKPLEQIKKKKIKENQIH